MKTCLQGSTELQVENTLFHCQGIPLFCAQDGGVCPWNERFLAVMMVIHLFLILIVHSLIPVVICWMEGIIWEGSNS